MKFSLQTLLAGAVVVLTFTAPVGGHAQSRRSGSHKTIRNAVSPHGANAAAAGVMPIDLWTPLSAPVSRIAPAGTGKRLDTTIPADRTEEITVFAKRHDYDREWRQDEQAAGLFYNARSSEAAQPLYAAPPVWDSPEAQRAMSDAKAAMGLCGALGGLITCPNQSP